MFGEALKGLGGGELVFQSAGERNDLSVAFRPVHISFGVQALPKEGRSGVLITLSTPRLHVSGTGV